MIYLYSGELFSCSDVISLADLGVVVGHGEVGLLHPAVDLDQVLDVGHDLVQLVCNKKGGLLKYCTNTHCIDSLRDGDKTLKWMTHCCECRAQVAILFLLFHTLAGTGLTAKHETFVRLVHRTIISVYVTIKCWTESCLGWMLRRRQCPLARRRAGWPSSSWRTWTCCRWPTWCWARGAWSGQIEKSYQITLTGIDSFDTKVAQNTQCWPSLLMGLSFWLRQEP